MSLEGTRARKANSSEMWDFLWEREDREPWRKEALSKVYERIAAVIPEKFNLLDLGGGIGILASILREKKNCQVTIADHSKFAAQRARELEIPFVLIDIIADTLPEIPGLKAVVATELIEHLDEFSRARVLTYANKVGVGIFSVPNNRLGPEEEPQHTIKFTALSFKHELEKFFKDVRVEVYEQFLLGICGVPKGYKLSVTMPVRDEEKDIELTLASFRGVADQLVVGIDPRSTDGTREICNNYCDLVFDLVDPEGPENERLSEGKVHFAWIRNQCIEKCTGDWVFMTEGHERLGAGVDTLLWLDSLVPKQADVCFVRRSGNGQQWSFPWLFKNRPEFRFKRSTHNVLDYPDGSYVMRLPQVKTIHQRHPEKENQRRQQRKIQNRLSLLQDWLETKNENSLYYLGSEWREYDSQRAKHYLQDFISLKTRNGPMRYQAKLILAKLYCIDKEYKDARELLLSCTADDWSRIEHWIWLGDLAYETQKYEESLQFYRYAGTSAGEIPFTLWWIDLAMYTYLPAQRLAMIYGELGKFPESLFWAKKVKELIYQELEPEEVPTEVIEEIDNNIKIIEEALNG